MKYYLKIGNPPSNLKQWRLPKTVNIIVNRALPVIVLLMAGFYFLPYFSMNFQNNNATSW